jgi:transposase
VRQIISEEKRRQIVAALKDNPNAKQVAQKIGGVSDTTVGKIAKAAGIALAAAKSRKRLSAEQRAQIITALKDNPNATQIAREVGGVNYRTVVRLAEGAGIDLTAGKAARGHPRVSSEKHAQIIAALKDNPNATQVARKIGGVSHTTVGKIAKAAGITLAAAESGKQLTAEKRAQIIAALKTNPNAAAVAKQIGGVSHVAVWKIAKAAGIELTKGKAARNHRHNSHNKGSG